MVAKADKGKKGKNNDKENEDSDGEPVFVVVDETDPTVIDSQDDYNEEQDRLQVNRLDKNRFVDQQSNLLLVTNKGDTPSLQQINKPILNNDTLCNNSLQTIYNTVKHEVFKN